MSHVAVIGAGAVGCYYGSRLSEAGHEVTFLLRRDYDAVASGGLHIHSPHGELDLARPSIARASSEIGPVDWVLCALKATALEDARDLIAPCIGEGTRILALMNGLGVEDRLAAWFGAERVFAGLAFTCINRGEPGHIHHLDYGAITLAHFLDNARELDAAGALWQSAKVEVQTSTCLLHARWLKLCWNIPFNGLAVTAGGITTDVVMRTPGLRAAAETVMREVIAAGNADLAAHGFEARLDAGAIVGSMMTATDAMLAYRPSTMIDFVEARPMEVDAIFGEPLRRAAALGVPTPYLALLTAQLRALDASRAG